MESCGAFDTPWAAGMSRDDAEALTRHKYYCVGVVHCVADTLAIVRLENRNSTSHTHTDHVCLPDGVSYEQMILVVVKYLKENPEQLHLMDNILIERALDDAFPCNKKAH